VTAPLYSDAAYVTWTSYRQIWRRTRKLGEGDEAVNATGQA